MVYSDTSNKNGIIQFTESLCRLGDGGITNDTTLFKQITSYINQADKKIAMAIMRVDKNWKFDDTKYTDFPIGTITLVNAQRDYTLPASTSGGKASTLYKINKVEVLDASGLPYPLHLLDPNAQETPNDTTYDGVPTHYRLIGNSIRLNPRPKTGDVTLTNGLIITFQRSTQPFTTASTTEEPGYFDAYHDLLAYYAAFSYLLPVNPSLAGDYLKIFEQSLVKLQDDWRKRNSDIKTVFRSIRRNPA